MDIFGIGPTELAFVVLIALILLGPKEMQKVGRTIGRWLRDTVSSDGWRAFRETSREIRNLPNRLMREANLEDMKKEVENIGKEINEEANLDDAGFGAWSSPTKPKTMPKEADSTSDQSPNNQIAPPRNSHQSEPNAIDEETDDNA